MSLRIVPAEAHPSAYTAVPQQQSAPSAPGVHDLLRSGLNPSSSLSASASNPSSAPAAPPVSTHPLEARLRAWESTQEALRMETLRRVYGVAEPVRRAAELRVVREGQWRPAVLAAAAGGSAAMGCVQEEILRDRDTTIDWEDVFAGQETAVAPPKVQDEMERRLHI